MDIILVLIAYICLVVGLLGAVLPLPGPPLSFIGLLIFAFTKFSNLSTELLWGFGAATAIISVLDYYIPIWGIKKFGGSKSAIWGSSIGLVIGMFLGPFGIFIGAFLGALVGELLAGSKAQAATKAAFGSFLGFISGIVLKLVLCAMMLYYPTISLLHYILP